MKNLFFILLFIPLVSLAQVNDFTKTPQLQTKATYTTEVIPDKITLSITLAEQNTKGKVSVEELEKRMEKVLLENNVDIQKQLTLKDISSNFKDYFLKKTDIQKTKNYQLEIFDAVSAGTILKELESQEISNVELLKTEYSKIEELKIELKGKAILKAKKQAEEMVKNLNQELGPAIYISDLETNIFGRASGLNVRGLNSISNQINGDDLDISFDKIRIEATVTVYFALK
ncbi:SIMPL domain-containing protein [Flavobacterium sp. NRK F10]|uniref:SIMPL domain-containing protein n=1 Tax=Flavobacterium sp. NRK F10 TaxID=2954931 RepID=UPI002091168E|nr:SIMPL domain-containing protein [Flavobacterium sp. NRK F10]MCO6176239.1 SIMPL domain-containing protein [Flavobacterium sp. NRK F10]